MKEMLLEPVMTQGMVVHGSKKLKVIHFSESSEMFNADFTVISPDWSEHICW